MQRTLRILGTRFGALSVPHLLLGTVLFGLLFLLGAMVSPSPVGVACAALVGAGGFAVRHKALPWWSTLLLGPEVLAVLAFPTGSMVVVAVLVLLLREIRMRQAVVGEGARTRSGLVVALGLHRQHLPHLPPWLAPLALTAAAIAALQPGFFSLAEWATGVSLAAFAAAFAFMLTCADESVKGAGRNPGERNA